MKYNIIFNKQADDDLAKIKFYISYYLNSPISAEKVINKIFDAISALSYFPYRYRILSKNIHIYALNAYSIYYLIDNNNVIILRILGSKQQFYYYDSLN